MKFHSKNSQSLMKQGANSLSEVSVHTFQLFPKKQILVLNVDDFNSKPQKTFDRVFNFLGLSHYNVKLIRYNSQKNPEIEPEIRKKLVEYFKPHNKKLYELLDEKFDWDK